MILSLQPVALEKCASLGGEVFRHDVTLTPSHLTSGVPGGGGPGGNGNVDKKKPNFFFKNYL